MIKETTYHSNGQPSSITAYHESEKHSVIIILDENGRYKLDEKNRVQTETHIAKPGFKYTYSTYTGDGSPIQTTIYYYFVVQIGANKNMNTGEIEVTYSDPNENAEYENIYYPSGKVKKSTVYDWKTGIRIEATTYDDGEESAQSYNVLTYREDGEEIHTNHTYYEDGSLHYNTTYFSSGWLKQADEFDKDGDLESVRVRDTVDYQVAARPSLVQRDVLDFDNGNKATQTTYWEPAYRKFHGDIAEIEGWHMDGSKHYEYSFTHEQRIWQLSLWPNPAHNTCCYN